MQPNNDQVWIFKRKALVAFAVAVISALGTLVGTLNNTAKINTLKSQNVRIEQQAKSAATSVHDKDDLTKTKQEVNTYKHKADVMEQKAAELQKDNDLLKRQVHEANVND